MYLLGIDNCVYSGNSSLVCGVTDFEVTVEGKIIALTDETNAANDGDFDFNATSETYYTKYNNKKGLTLIKD